LNYDAKVGLIKSQKKQKTGELNKQKGELNREKRIREFLIIGWMANLVCKPLCTRI